MSKEIRLFTVPREQASVAKKVIANLLEAQPGVKRVNSRRSKEGECDITFAAVATITTPNQAEKLRAVILERALAGLTIYTVARGGN